MKTMILYYSYTGNNALLAERAAGKTGAESFGLKEVKPLTTKTIIFDMLFNRCPKLEAVPDNIGNYDLVVFMGPIWMFHLASPLRSCFKQVKARINKYAFVSLSGGALGPNKKIGSELVRRLGKNMAFHIDLNIAHLCSIKKNATREDTGSYLLKDHPEDLECLTDIVAKLIDSVKT